MADNNKIPFGGRDWNKNGEYDNFDRMTDFYVYKKVTEDWEKNGAWDKDKKPVNQYPYQSTQDENELWEKILAAIFATVGVIQIVCVIWQAASEGLLMGLIGLFAIFAVVCVIL